MTGEDFQNFVIVAITDLRKYQIECVELLAVLRRDMQSVIGNGQPGRLDKCEQSIESLRVWSVKQKGMAIAGVAIASGVISVVGILMEYLRFFH